MAGMSVGDGEEEGGHTHHLEQHLPSNPDDCGAWCVLGRRLERLRRPFIFLLCISVASFCQSMCVKGLLGVTMSSVERQYGLSSSQSGWISAAYELAGIPLLVTLGLVGNRVHRPRLMGGGMVLLAGAALLYSSPHILFTTYTPSPSNTCDSSQSAGTAHVALLVFIVAAVTMAVAASPLYLFGTAYLDDCVSHADSALYLSIFHSCSALGPAVGYILASSILTHIYVHIGSGHDKPTSPADPHWVGAWWAGFVLCSILAALIGPPIFCFPRHMTVTPGEVCIQLTNQRGDSSLVMSREKDRKRERREGVAQVKLLLTNAVFLLTVFSNIGDAVLNVGFTTFGPKYVETQFSVTAGLAGTLFGLVTVPGAVGGIIVAGWFMKRLKLTLRGLLFWHAACHVTCLLLGLCSFLLTCPSPPVVGITMHDNRVASVNLSWACNSECACDRDAYDPVCGSDGLTYLSPCHAACAEPCTNTVCFNCSCVGQQSTNNTAHVGVCQSRDCTTWKLVIFLVLFFSAMFAFAATAMFSLQITLRCIDMNLKMVALSITWLVERTLGSVPGPLLFGAAIDTSCLFWSTQCNSRGSCLLYASSHMASLILLVFIICKMTCLLFSLAAIFCFRRTPHHVISDTVLKTTDDVIQ